jgi:hypothetical protein
VIDPRRPKTPDCLSDFRIDALIVGELEDEALRTATRHLEGCAWCRERRAALSTSYEETRAQLPPLRRPKKSVRGWLAAGAGALALAAAALLFVRTRPAETTVDATRIKGGDKLVFFVEHGGKVRDGRADERMVPGDKLQFAYSARQPVYVLVLSIDPTKEAFVYADGKSLMAPTTGNDVKPLPTSVELDGVLGEEHLFGLICGEARDAEALRLQLRREREQFRPPNGCTQTRWRIVKEAPKP